MRPVHAPLIGLALLFGASACTLEVPPENNGTTDVESDACTPDCDGKECGDDGCGGTCGSCPAAAPECSTDGQCLVPCDDECGDRECGEDQCGNSCGECPDAAPVCSAAQKCVTCEPDCSGKDCGDDGCGGSCGTCDAGKTCDGAGQCVCEPDCAGKECGDDGCGGSCGDCTGAGETCDASGQCVGCTADCTGKVCGDDGCGGSCGTCTGAGETCDASGQCVGCTADCTGKVCGDDGCGGSCGTCTTAGEACDSTGQCVGCVADCAGKDCGDDGCGGTCGSCPPGIACSSAGQCVCTPSCNGNECGPDGCGGSCGTCAAGESCNGGQCGPPSACTDADLAVVTTIDMPGIALSCFIGCNVDFACATGCIEAQSGISSTCVDCYSDAALCVGTTCATECFGTGSMSPQCFQCMKSNCAGPLRNCLGLSTCAPNCQTVAGAEACGIDGCGWMCGSCDGLCPVEGNCVATEVCDNGVDDDGDSYTDCEDFACLNAPACKKEICDNGVDDDTNTFTDCGDFQCIGDPACPTCYVNEDCADGQYCHKVLADCYGPGTCSDKPGICPTVIQPVCGCDLTTHQNPCYARAAGTPQLTPEACPWDTP